MKKTLQKIGVFTLGLALVFPLLAPVPASAEITKNMCSSLVRDLTLGSTGSDVVVLQTFLEEKGYLTIPTGVSKGYFGGLTRSAVAKYQVANGIYPTVGYFGKITQGSLVSACVQMADNTGNGNGNNNGGGLSGGDGDFDQFEVMGQPSNEDVEEGEEVEVLGFEFEADDSDLLVEKVEFTLAGNGDEKPWKFFEEVKLFQDGEEVASIDASDSDEWDETSTDDQYEATFSEVDAKANEGEMTEFTIAVVSDENIDDSDLPITWTVALTLDGVRALNADGINVYEGATSNNETFTLEEVATGTLDISAKSSDNDDKIVEVDADNDTDDVSIYLAEVESDEGDNTIEEVTVNLATTTGTVGELDEIIKTVYLFLDDEEVGSESVASTATGTTAILFDDLDVTIEEDDMINLEVRVDINDQEDNFTDGDEFYVDSVSVDFVDAQDEDSTETETTEGGEITLRVGGIMVELSSSEPSYTRVFTADDAGEKDRVEYTIAFEVSAFGDEDVYIDKSVQNTAAPSGSAAGVAWASTTDSTGTTTTSSSVFSASGDTSDDTTGYFLIEEGETRTFTLRITLEAGQDGAAGVRLTGINYDTDSTIGTDYYTVDLDDFKVDPVSVNII